jgi:hypothetical protein
MRIVKAVCLLVLHLATILTVTSIARADDVTDWNQHMLRAGTVGGTSPMVMTRVAAIVQASVFDAVNGIDRKYAPIHGTLWPPSSGWRELSLRLQLAPKLAPVPKSRTQLKRRLFNNPFQCNMF